MTYFTEVNLHFANATSSSWPFLLLLWFELVGVHATLHLSPPNLIIEFGVSNDDARWLELTQRLLAYLARENIPWTY